VTTQLPGPPLRIAVLGDFEGPHTQAWVKTFVERGHDVHAVSYYPVRATVPGVTIHVLREGGAHGPIDRPTSSKGAGRKAGHSLTRRAFSPSLERLVHAWRYQRAGLRRILEDLRPDVFHAHYAVEHAFYGAFAGYHPYVVSAWGSDLLVESHKALGRRIARYALRRADLVTGNDASLVRRAVELGVAPEKTAVVHLGIEPLFLEAGERSVNLGPETESGQAMIVSTRTLEPLYNPLSIIAAYQDVQRRVRTETRLVLAGDGSLRPALEEAAARAEHTGSVELMGHLDRAALAKTLASARVYVSVPSSDSLALSNLEAMAAGAFPIVSDLPSVDGWIEHGVNGFRVTPGDAAELAEAILHALDDPELRRRAALHNRELVRARGLREPNMLLMERYYYRLAGHPVEERGAI
jgi:glycosyltransferase involved in cell wall biosynthesis